VSSVLQTIVDRCLQKEPERRYAEARALLDDLKTVREMSTTTVPAWLRRVWTSIRRVWANIGS
jgi:hypothetical protein